MPQSADVGRDHQDKLIVFDGRLLEDKVRCLLVRITAMYDPKIDGV